MTSGQHARRGIATRAIPALVLQGICIACREDQVPLTIQRGVSGAVGVVLPFGVPPAATADVELPLARVRRAARGATEVIGPTESPVARRGRRCLPRTADPHCRA